MPKYRYRCLYRRSSVSSRIYRLTVTARDADEARLFAALADPEFAHTVSPPRRLGQVLEPERDEHRDGCSPDTFGECGCVCHDPTAAAKGREWAQDHGGYALVIDEGDE